MEWSRIPAEVLEECVQASKTGERSKETGEEFDEGMQVAITGVQKRDLDTDREIKKDAFLIQMIRNSVSIQRGQLTRKISMNKYKYIPLFKELQLELRQRESNLREVSKKAARSVKDGCRCLQRNPEYSRVNPGAVSEKRVVEKLEHDTEYIQQAISNPHNIVSTAKKSEAGREPAGAVFLQPVL